MAPMVMIDLTSTMTDDSDGERLPVRDRAVASDDSSSSSGPYCQTIELLAPLYPEIKTRTSPTTGEIAVFPITFQRTEADWIKLVFPHVSSSPMNFQSPPLEKELVCVNSAVDGCRNCHFVQLLRGLLVLMEKQVFTVEAKYVVCYPAGSSSASRSGSTTGSPGTRPTAAPVATIQLFVQLSANAPTSVNLQEFEFVTSHLQPAVLSVVGYTRVQKEALHAAEDSVKKAKQSMCHVVGCNLHQNDGRLPGLASKKLYLSDVFRSLTSPTDVGQMEIRDDETYLDRMKRPRREVIVTDLPITALQLLVCMMNARDLASLSGVCSLFQHLSYEVVPGLNLVLYRHQQKALKFLLYREAPPSAHVSALPHPFIFPPVHRASAPISIDLVDGRIVKQPTPIAQDSRGGLFCDEPGLGKTITMLALLLRTKGQRVKAVDRASTPGRSEPLGRLRSSESRGRTVHANSLVQSASSLIIVPDPLVEHWKYQIETHVEPGALNVFIDNGKTLPSCDNLATYDVVITSFTRLAQEWKSNRPASALEERAPERYGFEGPARYIDGEIRGEVSSLLRVHWVRIVVDEGHKLGGTTETNQMRMARIFCAEKRWVMTGTPTPNTLQSADLRHMHGLLVFLQDVPYGNPDGKAWLKAVAKPFEKNEPIGFLRLQHLLSRIMMRHTKHSIRDILPDPIRRTAIIDPTPNEYNAYNAVAASVRANLVATNYDPKYPGRLHLDSLLNPINRKYAMQVVSNLRTASCGGRVMSILLTPTALAEAVNYATQGANIEGEKLTVVMEYMRKAQQLGMSTACGSCKRRFQLLMLIPCGHLCCADCTGDRIESMGPSCSICTAVYDFEVFQQLQPGFEFAFDGSGPLEDLTNRGAATRARDRERDEERRQNARAWQERQRSGEPRAPQPRLAINFLRDFDIVDASKALYVVARVKELKKEYARAYAASSIARNASRHVKAIVFSQFKEHIWEVKVAFAQQGIPTADFIAGVSPEHRMKYLAKFRKDPNVNVLLLTEIGSHGLDLSFVTHMFLMEEIWDKSLEKQVVSRAHRMGARQAVVVEQLVMRDTIEGLLLRMNEQTLKRQERRLKAAEAEELELVSRNEQLHQNAHNQLNRTGHLENIFRRHNKSKKRHKGKSTATPVLPKDSNENKATRLQQQLYYVLHNLRLLGEDVVAEPGHVRFAIEDENGTTLRTGSHRMAAYKSSTGELVMMPPVTSSGDTSGNATANQTTGNQRDASSGTRATNVKAESCRGGVSTNPSTVPRRNQEGVTRQTKAVPPPEDISARHAAAPPLEIAAPPVLTSGTTVTTESLHTHGVSGAVVKSEISNGQSSSINVKVEAPRVHGPSTSLKTEPSEGHGIPTTPKAEPVMKAEPTRSVRAPMSAIKTESPGRKQTRATRTTASPSLGIGTSTDPVLLSDTDEGTSTNPILIDENRSVSNAPPSGSVPTLRSLKYEVRPASGRPASTTASTTAERRKAQKRPIRRVAFADDSETESDYVPSDSMSDD